MKIVECVAQNCHEPATLDAVDFLLPVLRRTPMPCCVRHALLWTRDDKGILVFPPVSEGEEASSLTRAEIAARLNPDAVVVAES